MVGCRIDVLYKFKPVLSLQFSVPRWLEDFLQDAVCEQVEYTQYHKAEHKCGIVLRQSQRLDLKDLCHILISMPQFFLRYYVHYVIK